jgi:hypothetical protein
LPHLPAQPSRSTSPFFGFAFVCSVLSGRRVRHCPAWLASRADVNQALKESPRGADEQLTSSSPVRLIVGEVCIRCDSLSQARTLSPRCCNVFENLGLRLAPDGLMTGQLGLLGDRYSTPPQRLLFYRATGAASARDTGVQHVAFSNSMPVLSFNSSGSVFIEGRPEPEPGKEPEAFFEQVSIGYFDTMGIGTDRRALVYVGPTPSTAHRS